MLRDSVGDKDWFSTIGMEDRVDWARPHYERAFAGYGRDEAVALIRRHSGWSVPFRSRQRCSPTRKRNSTPRLFSPMAKRRCDCRGASITRRRRRIPAPSRRPWVRTRGRLAALAAEGGVMSRAHR